MMKSRHCNIAFQRVGCRHWMVASALVISILAAQYFPFRASITASSNSSVKNDATIPDACSGLQSSLPSNSILPEPIQSCCHNDSAPCCCSPVSTHCPSEESMAADRKSDHGSQFIGVCGSSRGDHLYRTASLTLFNIKQPTTIVPALLSPVITSSGFKLISEQRNYSHPFRANLLSLYIHYQSFRC